MLIPAKDAAFNTRLVIVEIRENKLADRLEGMGVSVGDILIRLNEQAAHGPVKVKSPTGEVVLGAGVASKIITHHDDGHKTPIIEMQRGEKGHVEGLVCSDDLERSLAVLGVVENAEITMVRPLPPMEYQAIVDGRRIRMYEGMAAKIWGEMDGRSMQFTASARGKSFTVSQLLGGGRAVRLLRQEGVEPGKTLVLDSIKPAPAMGRGGRNQSVFMAGSGLRLYLRPDQAEMIFVRSQGE